MTSISDVEWAKVFKRLRYSAPTPGQAIIQMTVRVRDGVPVEWLEPTVTKIEPKRGLLEAIGGNRE